MRFGDGSEVVPDADIGDIAYRGDGDTSCEAPDALVNCDDEEIAAQVQTVPTGAAFGPKHCAGNVKRRDVAVKDRKGVVLEGSKVMGETRKVPMGSVRIINLADAGSLERRVLPARPVLISRARKSPSVSIELTGQKGLSVAYTSINKMEVQM